MRKSEFIFHDTGGRRWGIFKRVSAAALVVLSVALILFLNSLLVAPRLVVPDSFKDLKRQMAAYQHHPAAQADSESDRALQTMEARPSRASKPPPASVSRSGIRAAFFSGWDASAFRSLQANGQLLTHVCPEWLSYTNFTGGLSEDEDAAIDRLPEDRAFRLLPVLSNLDGSRRVPEAVEALAQAGPDAQQAFVEKLLEKLTSINAQGVVLDWEDVDQGEAGELSALIVTIADGLHAHGLETWLSIPVDANFQNWDFERLSPHVDRFVALLHDENGETDPAGPLASQNWFTGWLGVVTSQGNPAQWIASLGCGGEDWPEGSSEATPISFADAMSRAGNAGCSGFRSEAPDFNPTFSYFHRGLAHEVWFLDASTFANQWNAVRAAGLEGVAINRLGLEDPGIWQVLLSGDHVTAKSLPTTIPTGPSICGIGQGEIVSLDPTAFDGQRSFSVDPSGLITSEYNRPPSFPTLFRQGGRDPDKVAITFDDGPDPEWTPAILDILKARGVKATFFVVGSEAERNPDLIRRIVAEGNEIGNHSFTHPNLAIKPAPLIRLELNATERLIESLTGKSTILFRPPYDADAHPTDAAELVPIKLAGDLGYLTVLENVDPRDWQKPDPAALLKRIQSAREQGNILLLHDGGGDRSSTVAALPALLDYLKERGDEITTIAGLLGVDENTIMPALPPGRDAMNFFASGFGFRFLHLAQDVLWGFLSVATVLVLIRTILVIALARLHEPKPPRTEGPWPPVSVIVPAHNEETVIAKTLHSLLASDYAGPLDILVVDDGSTDGTAAAVRAIPDPRVRLVTQPNAGKAHALRNGVARTSGEILVFADADTQFEPDALRCLVSAFSGPEVGAVSGHARVGNRRTFLARCQDLEYVSGFNLDRRAFAVWNCITVAPGAISAIRREAITAAGGFSFDTLAEDTDLTLAIHRAGYRVEYAPDAVAHTEAPETFQALARQRFRWAYGTMQCVWKHRDMTFNPRFKALAWFSLPGIWFFQVALVALSPFIDLLFLQSLFFGHAMDVLPYFLGFLICDLAMAGAAVAMEGLPLREALRIIPQRFLYRPLLSYVVWKSLLHAMRGAWVGWGKLHRTGSVELP